MTSKADDADKPPGDRAFVKPRTAPVSRGQHLAGMIATGLLVLAVIYTLRNFIPALAWASVIAIGVWPLYERLVRRWPARQHDLLPALVILLILLVLVLPLMMVAFPLFNDSHAAAQWIEDVRVKGLAPPVVLQRLPYGPKLTQLWQAKLGQPGAVSLLTARATQGGMLEIGRRFGAEALHRLVLVGFMLLALFFLLKDAGGVADQIRIAGRRLFGAAGERVSRQLVRSVQGTVNGLVLVGLAEGLILGLVYWVAGVPRPSLFGLFTALLAMVPFGAGVALAGAVLALLMVNKLIAAAVVAAFGLLVTFAADHFVRPVLIGGATKLPFLWVLLGILGGVETWGLVGLFVGPALLAALILLWREWVGQRRGAINPPPKDVDPAAT
jgi:predicted PurR-regulated permease PerM